MQILSASWESFAAPKITIGVTVSEGCRSLRESSSRAHAAGTRSTSVLCIFDSPCIAMDRRAIMASRRKYSASAICARRLVATLR